MVKGSQNIRFEVIRYIPYMDFRPVKYIVSRFGSINRNQKVENSAASETLKIHA